MSAAARPVVAAGDEAETRVAAASATAETDNAAVPDANGMEPNASDMATCDVCPHRCRLRPGAMGFCRARRNVDGVIRPQNYGRVTSIALDPIEKKPLARYLPGSYVLSVGGYGCNLRCPFCQNWQISQADERQVPWREVSPEELVAMAQRSRERDPRVVGIALTYNEPLVSWEYVRDCCRLARQQDLRSVLVSNGCAEPWVVRELAPLIDAANIDMKGFSLEFYQMCDGDFAAVKRTIETLAATPTCHLEVTTLLVPGKNDLEDQVASCAQWLASLDPNITYHVTRFFPAWHLQDVGPTPVATVYHMAEVARRYLPHVQVGNC